MVNGFYICAVIVNVWFTRSWSVSSNGSVPEYASCFLPTAQHLYSVKFISKDDTIRKLICIINWLPRSPDLSPLDYFLKEKLYQNHPRNMEQWKHKIKTEMAAAYKTMCQRVIINLFEVRWVSTVESSTSRQHNIVHMNLQIIVHK